MRRTLLRRGLAAVCLLAACAAGGAWGDETIAVRDRTGLVEALRKAKPGTRVLLAPGTYAGGLAQAGLKGTAAQPIVVAGADPVRPPVIEGGASGLQLSSPEHLELRDLVFRQATGNGLNIDDSGSAKTPAHHLTLRRVVVRDVGPKGNCDGIKLSGVNDFAIENCRIERWGSSGSAIDMVGCGRGTLVDCEFKEGGGDYANGVQAKGGSREIAVQRCRFVDCGGRGTNIGGHTGEAYFRPKLEEFEARAITVEDCEFHGSAAAICFVGVDGAVVRNNLVVRPTRWPIRILQENMDERFVPCREGLFENNVVVFRSDEVRQIVNVGGRTAPETFRFQGNVWYCADRPGDSARLVRLPGTDRDSRFIDPGFQDPKNGDYRLTRPAAEGPGPRLRKAEGPN